MQSDTLIDNGPIIQFASSEGPTDGVSAIVPRIGTSTLSSSPGFSRLHVLEHIRKRETLGEGMNEFEVAGVMNSSSIADDRRQGCRIHFVSTHGTQVPVNLKESIERFREPPVARYIDKDPFQNVYDLISPSVWPWQTVSSVGWLRKMLSSLEGKSRA